MFPRLSCELVALYSSLSFVYPSSTQAEMGTRRKRDRSVAASVYGWGNRGHSVRLRALQVGPGASTILWRKRTLPSRASSPGARILHSSLGRSWEWGLEFPRVYCRLQTEALGMPFVGSPKTPITVCLFAEMTQTRKKS